MGLHNELTDLDTMEGKNSSNVCTGGDNNNLNSNSQRHLVRGLPTTNTQRSVVEPAIIYRVPTANHNINNNNNRRGRLLRIVCISDTHNHHRSIDMPPSADLLIHAGDFTSYGKLEHLVDFNEWLGELPYKHKIVVNGNHEYKASWKSRTKSLLTNAIFLKNQTIQLHYDNNNYLPQCQEEEEEENDATTTSTSTNTITIHGTNFFWPALDATETNGCLDKIPNATDGAGAAGEKKIDILVSHCPAKSYVDCGRGCPALARKILQGGPLARIVISGHEHDGRGLLEVDSQQQQLVVEEDGGEEEDAATTKKVLFVNCATSQSMSSRAYGKQPIILEL